MKVFYSLFLIFRFLLPRLSPGRKKSVNPRVLTRISDVADHEWIQSSPFVSDSHKAVLCYTISTDVRCEREVINDVGFTRQFIKVRVLLLFRCFISEKCGNAAFLLTTLVSHSLTCKNSVIPYCCCHGGKYFRFVE